MELAECRIQRMDMVDNGWDQVLNGRFDQIQEDGCRMFHVKKLICNFQLKSTFSWCLPTTGYVKRLNEIFPSYMGALTWKNSSRLSFVKIWLTSFWARLLQNELHTTHYIQNQSPNWENSAPLNAQIDKKPGKITCKNFS